MFSPLVRRELADDPLVGWTAHENACWRRCRPISKRPAGITDSKLRQRLAAARASGRLVIGHFGSIYPGKQPNALLDICAILRERGLKPLLVYVGSFIRGTDKVEEEFYARAAELGITDDVIVSGYVASDHEVFGIFSEVDAFCYPLEEGITGAARQHPGLRRSPAGRSIVTGPAGADEFDHHPRFKELIDRGVIALVPRGAGDDAYADRIMSALKQPPMRAPFDFEGWWRDVAQAVQAQLASILAPGIAPDNAVRIPRSET